MKIITRWPQDNSNVKIHSFEWEICKIGKLAKLTIFRQGRGVRKLQFFLLSGKPSKVMKIITRWPQDNSTVKMQNLESRKNWPFRQVYSHRKLQYFRLSEKTPKMMKIITRWPQDNSNVKIHSFGWEICKIGKVAKNAFFDRSAVIENFNFFDFLESLWKWWKSSSVDYRTTKMKTKILIWRRNMQNWEISKIDNFSTGPWCSKTSIFST